MNPFHFKLFGDMTDADYATVGFMSGLEIHQQLLTTRKLFCRCPAGQYSDHYHAEILRHMRPTLSELGEYDGTALMEFKTKKDIVYRINRDTVCTYEMDDTPPFMMDEKALDSALSVALMYQCAMVDELHIARKQYLDGSIPTGFQRTTIVGVDGTVPYKDRQIRIVQLGLEEDACREVSDVGHQRVYLTDRLGMPLIETVTAPDMRTPIEVAEVAQLLRRIVRSTGRVRTGIGAAREDVNVSVTGGTRIEIKGVPRIPDIPLLTYNEAMRQWNLLRLREELAGRGITQQTFQSRTENVSRFLKKTRFMPIHQAITDGMIVNAVSLHGYHDLMRWRTQTDTFFAREISDRLRVIACLTTLPNMIHSDSPSDTLSSAEWQAVKKSLSSSDDDAVVIVWGSEIDAATGAREIAIRAREATIGVPSETRQALPDGTNGFERILPGPDRMYPDTDLPPICITQERLEQIRLTLPSPVWERERRYRDLGIPDDVVLPLASSPYAPLFEQLVTQRKLAPTLAAVALIQWRKRLRRDGLNVAAFTPEVMAAIFERCGTQPGAREAIRRVMFLTAQRGSFDESDCPVPATDEEMQISVKQTAHDLAAIEVRYPEKANELHMGLAMNILRGRVSGTQIAAMVGFRKENER
jgi:glutamyl-tRNA(Gln) amidotransferase subunit E